MSRRWQLPPRNVVLLGLVSFFNDSAAEMVYPLVPIFLTSILHTPIPILGFMEGIVEAVASLTKYGFGVWSDRVQKRKPFVVAGYAGGALSKILIGLAMGWPMVLTARFIDRLGKGLRTAARDSMLLAETQPHNKGYIFGFHRAFDSLGAVVGPLLALLALQVFQENLRMVFFLAFIPSCVTLAILIWFVRERTVAARSSAQPLGGISLTKLSPVLLMFLLVSFLFSLGNSSDVFLLLQAKNLGLSTTMVVLAYILYNVSQSVGATPLGALADRLGAKNVYAGGLAVFALVYFLFGYVQQAQWMWILFPLYGLYISATDGVSKSFIAEYITKEESGTYFGAYYTLIALGGFAASMIGGLLWSHLGPAWTFYFGSAMAVVALIAFFVGWRIPERV